MSPPSSPHTRNILTHLRRRAKDGVSPGIEPGTTRNIDLEFSRTAVTRISLSEYHTARPRDLDQFVIRLMELASTGDFMNAHVTWDVDMQQDSSFLWAILMMVILVRNLGEEYIRSSIIAVSTKAI
jgi:hypothetical protein